MSEKRERETVRIEYIIGNPEDPDLHLVGKMDRRAMEEGLRWLGLRYETRMEALPKPMRVSCDKSSACTDYLEKCSECAWNSAKSYFQKKVEG